MQNNINSLHFRKNYTENEIFYRKLRAILGNSSLTSVRLMRKTGARAVSKNTLNLRDCDWWVT